MPLEDLMEDNAIEESTQAQAKPDAADYQWAARAILHMRAPWSFTNTRSGSRTCPSALLRGECCACRSWHPATHSVQDDVY
jgi:hypothetical protein